MKLKAHLTGFLIFIFILFYHTVFAQWESVLETQYFSDGKLKTATKNTHYGEMEGSPFLYDNWSPGEARLSDGKTYKDLLLKYDELTGTLMFKYKLSDSAMAFQYRPLEFKFQYVNDNTLFNVHFLNGFKPVDKADTNTFYQVLTDGKTKLLKRESKNINEYQQFGSNATVKKVLTKINYYLVKNNQLLTIKNDKKSLLNALNDQQEKIKRFISDNNIELDGDTGLVQVVEYYNTL